MLHPLAFVRCGVLPSRPLAQNPALQKGKPRVSPRSSTFGVQLLGCVGIVGGLEGVSGISALCFRSLCTHGEESRPDSAGLVPCECR